MSLLTLRTKGTRLRPIKLSPEAYINFALANEPRIPDSIFAMTLSLVVCTNGRLIMKPRLSRKNFGYTFSRRISGKSSNLISMIQTESTDENQERS